MLTSAAVIREKNGPFIFEQLDLEERRADEALIRIVGAGVCHTGALVRNGSYETPMPAVLGHEGSGIAEAVGSAVVGVFRGDHVVLSVNSCGRCRYCLTGDDNSCVDLYSLNFGGARLDGSTASRSTRDDCQAVSSHFFGQSSFSQMSIVAARSIVKVPKEVPLELLGPLGYGSQTGAGAVMNSLRPPAGSSIAVFGARAVGLSAVLAARAIGCTKIITIGVLPERLQLALELGATDAIDARERTSPEEVMKLTDGHGVEFALETAGQSSVLRSAIDSPAIRGKCGQVGGQAPGTVTALETGLSMTRGWQFQMVIEGDSNPQIFIPQLIQLWQQGCFPLDKLIQFYEFEQIEQAFSDSAAGLAIKPVLLVNTKGD